MRGMGHGAGSARVVTWLWAGSDVWTSGVTRPGPGYLAPPGPHTTLLNVDSRTELELDCYKVSVICTHNYLCLFVCVSVWGRPGLGSVSMSTCKQNFVSQFSPLITLHCQSGSSGSCACTHCTPVHAALYTSYHGKTEASIKTHAYQLQLSALFTAESSHAHKVIHLISKVLDIGKKWKKKQKKVPNGQMA